MIPLVDLARQHEEIAGEVARGWDGVVARSSFVQGPEVGAFEEAFAAFCGVGHCVGVGSGTDALELAVRALGVGRGDEVVVPANTFIASALAVLRAGADVVLVDADPVYHLMDVEQTAAALGPRVKAIMPVHLYGQTAPVEELRRVVGDRAIVEDAAQAQGARRNGVAAGSLGTIAGTSFYPGKNLGCYGDGGAVLTDDASLAGRVRSLGNWGSEHKYHHPEVGFNSRLDSLQAVVLSAKLRRLQAWNEARRTAASRYGELLSSLPEVGLPAVLGGNEHIWHLYVIRVPRRDAVVEKMHASGIGVGIHYPVPIHLQGALSSLGYEKGSFPVTERAADEILSLPLFPGITTAEQEQVVAALRSALRS